jgi:hypothetical protein
MLEEIQEEIAIRIKTHEQFGFLGGNVITRKESDVDALVTQAVNQDLGIAVVVLYPFPEEIIPNAPGLVCDKISIQLQVRENTQVNATGVSCLKCAELLHRLLHMWVPPVEGLRNNCLTAEQNNPWADPPTEPGINEIILKFRTAGEEPPL